MFIVNLLYARSWIQCVSNNMWLKVTRRRQRREESSVLSKTNFIKSEIYLEVII